MAGLDWGGTQYTALEIIQPRASMPSMHRMRFAYPGIPYTIRIACAGGVYPYQFSILSGAGAGMTIDAGTGVISWPNPTTSCTPVIKVEDTKGLSVTETWTITVGTSGWYFLDASASPGGTGTIGSPFKTLSQVVSSTVPHSRVYIRTGSYNFTGIPMLGAFCNPGQMEGDYWRLQAVSMADKWIAYPGDTAPVINFGGQTCNSGAAVIGWSGETLWMEGLNCQNAFWKFFDGAGGANGAGTFYRNQFHAYALGTSNSSFLMWNHQGPPRGYGAVIQDNYFHNDDGASANNGLCVLWYDLTRSIFEANTMSYVEAAVSPKAGNDKFTIRGNIASNFVVQGAHFLSSNFDDYAPDGTDANGEICFNNLVGPFDFDDPSSDLGAIELGPTWPADGVGRLAFYRNTVVGTIGCSGFPSSYGPFPFVQNVIVNTYSSTSPYPFFKEISGFPPPAWSAVQDTNNLKGLPASNIVDSSGNLLGTYRSTWLYYRGYEVPPGGGGGGTTPPVFSSASSTTFQVGVAGTFSVVAAPSVTAIARTGSLPTGVTYTDNANGTGTLAGTPAVATNGIYPLTFTATNVDGDTPQSFTLTVNPPTPALSVPVSVGDLRTQGIL